MERLDKVISNANCLTRSQARRLIKIGHVCVNGVKTRIFDTKVSENDEITVEGKTINNNKNVYIMMNKPAGVVCDDKSHLPYAPNILPEDLRRKDLFCVGRLDKDTTGLLLITNDGEFAHKIISPKKHISKKYRAVLDEPITQEAIDTLENGITLSDGTALSPAKIEIINDDKTEVIIEIFEGKYHQIKRMAGAVSNKVNLLERISIGGLKLNELSVGDAKELTEIDTNTIYEQSVN